MDKDQRIAELEKQVRRLQDRADIHDCLVRYCRGIDRNDPELALTAYHDDALDEHGAMAGPARFVVESALLFHNSNQSRTQHSISNVYMEIDGDVASCETHYQYAGLNNDANPAPVSIIGGRYVDRFERRDGVWKIARRISIIDWYGQPGGAVEPPEGMEAFNAQFPPTRDKSDPSYMRPIDVHPARMNQGYAGWKKS